MTSVLNVDEIAAKDGTSPVALTKQSAAKAFHAKGNQSTGDFNSGAHTFNISNYVDHATGISRLNLTNAMTDSEYCVIGSSHSYDYQHFPVSSSQYSCGNVNSSGNLNDGITHGAVHGDLA